MEGSGRLCARPTPGRLDRAEPLANPARVNEGEGIMRTLRLSLAGTVILALLGGVGGAVVAQEVGTSRRHSDHVHGTHRRRPRCRGKSRPSRRSTASPWCAARAPGCYKWETTDPRVNGESVIYWNYDDIPARGESPEGSIGTARERITTRDRGLGRHADAALHRWRAEGRVGLVLRRRKSMTASSCT